MIDAGTWCVFVKGHWRDPPCDRTSFGPLFSYMSLEFACFVSVSDTSLKISDQLKNLELSVLQS